MRLTLRTLLAYMDDILEPSDHEDLGNKIEASEFATELIHRSRDTVRRLRLGAPAVLASGSDDVLEGNDVSDANTVAEYLDNTLPPEQVAEFERVCLEQGHDADMHLAEVASCHHVLTMVLGEPADVEPGMKSRMYQLTGKAGGGPRLRIEPAHTDAVATAPPVQAAAPVSPPVSQPVSVADHELPDYLREAVASRKRSRRWAIVATLLALVGLGYWFATAPEGQPPAELAQSDLEGIEGEIDISGLDEMMTGDMLGGEMMTGDMMTGDMLGDQPAQEAIAEESETAPLEGATPEAPAESLLEIEPDSDGAAQPETIAAPPMEEEAIPVVPVEPMTELAPSEMETPTETLESEPTIEPSLSIPPAEESATEELVITETPLEQEEMVEAEGAPPLEVAVLPPRPVESEPMELAEQQTTAEPPAPVGPQRLGNYLGNNDVLLILDEATRSWVRVPPRSPISTGDVLLSLPKFHTHVVLADVNTYFSGGTRLRIPVEPFAPGTAAADLNLEVVFGRLLLNAGLKGSNVAIKVGDQLREFELDGSASLAVEVKRVFTPGADYENQAAPIRATWYLTVGSVTWPTAAGSTQTISAPAMWQTIDGIDEIPEMVQELPEWIDREGITDVERIACGDLDEALKPGEAVGLPLLELTQGQGLGRKKEVRILAAASSILVGEFEPLVAALGDSDQKRAWEEHIGDLRQALARSPADARRVRQAFVHIRGEEAADDLMEMLIGYDRQELGESLEAMRSGALTRLIGWLDDESLDYRVLAIHNIQEITGASLGYSPDASSKHRTIALRKIWDRFDAGELLPKP